MKKIAFWGLVGTTVALAASCGARVEIVDNESAGGAGGAGESSSSGSNSTGSSVGSSGSVSSSSGGMTSSSSGGMTSSSSGGMTSSSSSSSGGVICPPFGDLCTECLSVQCADLYCACYGNFDCISLSNCLNGCNDDAPCEQQCYTEHPNGASVLYALSSCGGTNCPVDCPGTQPLEPCTQCMVETCSDELNKCLAFAPCQNLYQCLSDCPPVDLACNQQCYANFGDGVPTLQTLLSCSKTNCPDC